jgi:transcriptional regulator with XRE-family HTH domain
MSKTQNSEKKMNKEELIKSFEIKYKEDDLRYNDLPGTNPSWTPEKLVRLYDFIDSGLTQEEIADELGFERSTISRKLKAMDWDKFENKLQELYSQSITQYIKSSAVEYREKAEKREAFLFRKKEINNQAFYDNLETKMLECVSAMEVPKLPKSNLLTPKGTPEHIVLMLSDLHVGLNFTDKETGKLNKYNLEVFRQRALNLKKAVIDIFSLHSKLYPIPELHIFGLGDMVQGTNLGGEWGPAYIDMDVYEQANIAGNTVADLISEWSNYFKKITFTGIVGNHGRGGKDKNSDKVAANWDNVSYIVLSSALRNHPNVEIIRSDAWWSRTNVNGSDFLMVHGDYLGSTATSLETESRKLQDMLHPLGLLHLDICV